MSNDQPSRTPASFNAARAFVFGPGRYRPNVAVRLALETGSTISPTIPNPPIGVTCVESTFDDFAAYSVGPFDDATNGAVETGWDGAWETTYLSRSAPAGVDNSDVICWLDIGAHPAPDWYNQYDGSLLNFPSLYSPSLAAANTTRIGYNYRGNVTKLNSRRVLQNEAVYGTMHTASLFQANNMGDESADFTVAVLAKQYEFGNWRNRIDGEARAAVWFDRPVNNYTGEIGTEVTFAGAVSLTHIGVYVHAASLTSPPTITFKVRDNADVEIGTATLNLAGKPAGEYAYVAFGAPIALSGLTPYKLLISVTSGGSFYWSEYWDAYVTELGQGITAMQAIRGTPGSFTTPAEPTSVPATTGSRQSYGPIDFKIVRPAEATGSNDSVLLDATAIEAYSQLQIGTSSGDLVVRAGDGIAATVGGTVAPAVPVIDGNFHLITAEYTKPSAVVSVLSGSLASPTVAAPAPAIGTMYASGAFIGYVGMRFTTPGVGDKLVVTHLGFYNYGDGWPHKTQPYTAVGPRRLQMLITNTATAVVLREAYVTPSKGPFNDYSWAELDIPLVLELSTTYDILVWVQNAAYGVDSPAMAWDTVTVVDGVYGASPGTLALLGGGFHVNMKFAKNTTVSITPSAGQVKTYFDGTLVDTLAIPALTLPTDVLQNDRVAPVTSELLLGNRRAADRVWQGDLAELFWINEVNTAKRQILEGHIMHKWGLQAQLPALHPYKASAPA